MMSSSFGLDELKEKFLKMGQENAHSELAGRTLNFLLLGETGVGKSLFVNAFNNAIPFPKLDDALKSAITPIAAISTTYTVIRNGSKHTIKVGKDDSKYEKQSKPGQSCTQLARVHPIRYGQRHTIRFVDPPGLLDPQGGDQDESNIDRTFALLANLEEIHGICIVIRAGSTRMTTDFLYCMSQILINLHKDAAKNIIFIITRCDDVESKMAIYEVIQELLKGENGVEAEFFNKNQQQLHIPFGEHNFFCMDNGGYSYLSKCKNHAYTLEEAEEGFNKWKGPWMRAEKEFVRLITYGSHLPPHKIFDMQSVTHAKWIIRSMSGPLIDNEKAIQFTMDSISETELKIESLGDQAAVYAIDMNYMKGFTEQDPNVTRPYTVCMICTGNVHPKASLSQTVCHENCSLGQEVILERKGDPGLQRCACMDYNPSTKDARCRCGHSYLDHMHVKYKVIYKEVPAINEAMKDKRDKALLDKKEKAEGLASLKQDKLELLDEKQKIYWACGIFAGFFEEYSMGSYNDSMKEHLEREHKNVKNRNCYNSKAEKEKAIRLAEINLNRYTEIKKLIDDYLEHKKKDISGKKITANDIEHLKKDLFKLKHNGPNIERMFKMEENAQEMMKAEMKKNWDSMTAATIAHGHYGQAQLDPIEEDFASSSSKSKVHS